MGAVLSICCRRARVEFIDLPNDAMLVIARFLCPPDVYSLCLTCSRFHQPAYPDAVSGSSLIAESSSPPPRGGDAPDALLATKMLRFSLLLSLDHVLRKSKSGITLDQLNKLFEHETVARDNVIIAGSIIVQCIRGEAFDGGSDIDIFAMNSAAPAARSWLMKEAHQLCLGFADQYVGPECLAQAFLNKIHHVEQYCNCPPDGTPCYPEYGLGRGPFSYTRCCQFGRQINNNYYPTVWQRRLLSYDGGVPEEYDIQPLPGDPFAFAFGFYCADKEHYHDNSAAFDLVVAKDEECESARDLSQHFDIQICKSAYNGKIFTIQDPHYAFTGRSKMEPRRNALMKTYHTNYRMQADPLGDDFALARQTFQDAALHFNMPMFSTNDDDLRGRLEELTFHSFVYKLFARLAKYQSRGIEVEDCVASLSLVQRELYHHPAVEESSPDSDFCIFAIDSTTLPDDDEQQLEFYLDNPDYYHFFPRNDDA